VRVHRIQGAPAPDLARSLAAFEREFRYPLGAGGHFRIEHGDDYPLFYRSMGDAACFVAEADGRVVGTACAALRPVLAPDGRETLTGYVGDLKVSKTRRGGLVLWRLAQALTEWGRDRATTAFAVVMDGTTALPSDYTGRAGLPGFEVAARTRIVGLPAAGRARRPSARAVEAPLGDVAACYARLSRGRFAVPVGRSSLRSVRAPTGFVLPGGEACVVLEDTARAKRLWREDGTEIVSGHLSTLAFATPEAGAEVVSAALEHCARDGIPAAWAAVAPGDEAPLLTALCLRDVIVAPATVYAVGFPLGAEWNVNTAEV
jgi:hypothetical protein